MEMTFFGAVPVDKHRISTKIKAIAVEAFGRHLKRVDASALFFGEFYSLLGMVALDREEISAPVLIFLFSSRSKRSYHMMPIQPPAHLNLSIIHLVIPMALFTILPSHTLNMQ